MKAYPAYKDSGVEWLGEIPEGWVTAPLKTTANILNGADYKLVESEHGYPVIGSGGPFATASEYLYDGKSVLLGRKGTIDRPLYIDGPFWAVDTMYYTRILPNHDAKFIYYCATTIPFDFYSTSTALPSMTKGQLGAHSFAMPPLSEQQSIAAYLDRETAQIDELIGEQEALIESLTERRQSVITHAVTKGLDPTVEMKDSGTDWLGEVPKHWTVNSVGRDFSVVLGKMLDGARAARIDDVDLPYLRAANIQEPDLVLESVNRMPFTADERRNLDLRRGDLLVTEGGASVGATHVLDSNLPGFSFQKTINRVRPLAEADSRFVAYVIRSYRASGIVELICNKATIPHFTAEKLRATASPCPPVNEQQQIADYLDDQTSAIGTLTTECRELITLLKERRSALISAAVTGKIDVRGFDTPLVPRDYSTSEVGSNGGNE